MLFKVYSGLLKTITILKPQFVSSKNFWFKHATNPYLTPPPNGKVIPLVILTAQVESALKKNYFYFWEQGVQMTM